MRTRLAAFLLALSFFPATPLAGGAPPPLMLANHFHADIRLADYWVSEKFDGVRGYWDGERLLTRGGELIQAPQWFTAGWPKLPLDGELWAGRGRFSRAVSIIRQAQRTMRHGARCISCCSICPRIRAISANAMPN